jgi:hypothetical protein
MALTKEKLISRLQTQIGLNKQESRSVVERVLDIMKESLAAGEEILREAKERPPGPESSDQRESHPPGPQGGGI